MADTYEDRYRQALADIQAIPAATPEPPEQAPGHCGRCPGDRRGYQWHKRRGEDACPATREANRLYFSAYKREWLKRNPDYARQWRAKRRGGGSDG